MKCSYWKQEDHRKPQHIVADPPPYSLEDACAVHRTFLQLSMYWCMAVSFNLVDC